MSTDDPMIWQFRTWLTIRFILWAMWLQGYYGNCYDHLLQALLHRSRYEYDKFIEAHHDQ